MSVQVGEITYTNILPLYYYINRAKLSSLDVAFVPQVPSKLNEQMKSGKIDVGAISSFAYGENFQEYYLLPDLSVSASGKVGSIFLFSKVPIEELNGASIALTSSSATSVHLLKVMLQEFYALSVHYKTVQPNLEAMLIDNDACLLIGDDAIDALWNEEADLYRYDLGELWTSFTNLPITFAVVAVRKAVLEKEAKAINILYEEMVNSKKKSLRLNFKPMIKDIKTSHKGSHQFWENYFSGLDYEFSTKHFKGLELYYDLCYKYRYLAEVPTLSFVNSYVHS
jgi:chorismate dehydratase